MKTLVQSICLKIPYNIQQVKYTDKISFHSWLCTKRCFWYNVCRYKSSLGKYLYKPLSKDCFVCIREHLNMVSLLDWWICYIISDDSIILKSLYKLLWFQTLEEKGFPSKVCLIMLDGLTFLRTWVHAIMVHMPYFVELQGRMVIASEELLDRNGNLAFNYCCCV